MVNPILQGQVRHIGKKTFKPDTVYVRGVQLKTYGDTAFQLIFKSKGVKKIVYTEFVQGGAAVDLSFDFDYKSDSVYYKCFLIYDGVVGTKWSIFWDRKTNFFYKSQRYDTHVSNDTLIRESVNFKKHTALVYHFSGDETFITTYTYVVKLKQIWPHKKRARSKLPGPVKRQQ